MEWADGIQKSCQMYGIEIGGIYDIKEEKRIEAKEKGFFCVWFGRGNVIRPGY